MSKTNGKMKQRSVTKDDVELGKKIRAFRLQVQKSQEDLASSLGISFQQVQKYEKGVNRVSHVRLTAIAKALGCTIGDLSGSDLPSGAATNEMIGLLGDNMIRRGAVALHGMDRELAYKFVTLMETTESTLAAS